MPDLWKLAKRFLQTLIARPFIDTKTPNTCPIGSKIPPSPIQPDGEPRQNRFSLDASLDAKDSRLYDATNFFTDLLNTFRPHVFSFPEDVIPISLEQILTSASFHSNGSNNTLKNLNELQKWVNDLPALTEYNNNSNVPFVDLGNVERITGNTGGTVYARALICPRDYIANKVIILEYTFVRPVSYWFSPDETEGFLFEHEGDNERCAIIVRADPRGEILEKWAVSGVAFEMHTGGSEEFKGLQSCGDSFKFPKSEQEAVVDYTPSSIPSFKIGGPDGQVDGRPQIFIARGSHAICPESGYRDLPVKDIFNVIDLYPDATSDNELMYDLVCANKQIREILYCGENRYAFGNYNREGIVLGLSGSGEYQTPKPKDKYQILQGMNNE